MPAKHDARCLRDYLAGFEGHSILWKSADQTLSVEYLSCLLSTYHKWVSQFAGLRVAIICSNMLHLASLLLMLDGLSEAILLIPSGLSVESVGDFLRRASVDLLITDKGIPAQAVEQVRLNLELEADDAFLAAYAPQPNLCRYQTQWIIPTSGTTDTPKLVCHTLESLTDSIKRATKYGSYRWGLLYDLTRFAGLQVFLQSFLNASLLIFTDYACSLEEQIRALVLAECNALSATPTMWRKILMSDASEYIPLKQITLGGEIADAAVLAALARAYPDTHITHIYASTEAGVGFAVHDGLEGFPKEYLETPPKGIEIAVSEDGLLLLRKARQAQFFLDVETSLYDDEGWINTGDLVELKGSRYIFLGRASGAINVGGSKVYPEEVERVILQVPGVA